MYDRRNLFLIDQAAHLLTILGIAFWIGQNNITELYREEAELFFHTFDVSETVFLKWILVLLLIHKPAKYTYSKYSLRIQTGEKGSL